MLGRPEWFTYRSAGWGIAPRTWQGWVYILSYPILMAILIALPISGMLKTWFLGGLIGLLVLDSILIWSQLSKCHDERERLHQLIIERNCSLAAVFSILAVMGYQIHRSACARITRFPFDPQLLVVLGVMVATKFISTLYVRRRM